MSEDYKRIVRRVYDEVFGQGKLEVADEIIAAGCVDHEMPGGGRGPDALKQVTAMFRSAFPDFKMTMDDAIVDGNQIAVRFTATGTHQGEFAGVPATGKSITMNGIDILRFENGMVVEHWGYSDQMGLMQQIGAMPTQ
jgi:steroid delta-isomerase-like uncharacterized protein